MYWDSWASLFQFFFPVDLGALCAFHSQTSAGFVPKTFRVINDPRSLLSQELASFAGARYFQGGHYFRKIVTFRVQNTLYKIDASERALRNKRWKLQVLFSNGAKRMDKARSDFSEHFVTLTHLSDRNSLF